MRKSTLSILLLVAGLLVPATARADVSNARSLLLKGEYSQALAEYKKSVRGAEKGEALVGQAVVLRRIGRYAKAAKIAKKALRVRSVRGRAAVVYARALVDVGKYKRAIKTLKKALQWDAKNYAARAELGQVYTIAGQKLRAGVMWKDLFRDWDNGILDKKRGDHTYYVGQAGQGTKNWQFASDAFEKAVKLSPKLYEANIRWGYLFMNKNNVPDAEKSFKDVLKYDMNHPDAWAGRAWVEWNAARPKKALGKVYAEKALKINRNHVEAMLYLASMAIYDSEYGRAIILVNRALRVNPNHLRALAHLGAIHFLREKKSEYTKVLTRLHKVNKEYPDFYTIIARFTNRHHQYPETVALLKKAKAIDAKDEKALAALGVALLRTGEEGEGIFWLKEAWKLDRFNHQTMNLLNLYDDLAKKYVTLKVGRFEFKVAKDEAKVIKRYVPKLMNDALKRYMKKYKWKPPKAIKVELYDSQKDFTVRTFGEPTRGGILGVCFGPVITALSPSIGRANWAMVLTHELAHTVHIAISRGRVARWFTEGLAEYETIIQRPEWKREHGLDIYRAIKLDSLRGIDTLNLAFSHSKTPKGVVIAYYQSSQVIRFMAGRWGYKALIQAMKLYGKNKSTSEIIPVVTKLSTADFDKAFKKWMLSKYRHYDNNFDPYAASVVPLDTLIKRAKKAPKSAAVQARLAVGYLFHRRRGKFKATLARVRKLDPKNPIARYLQAGVLIRKGKRTEARKILEGLIKDKRDGYFVRMTLGSLARRDKNLKAAIAHYGAAHKLDPERTTPLDMRIRLFSKQKKELELVQEMTRLAKLREGSARLLYSIVVRASKLKRWDIVRKFGLQAVHSQPLNMIIHEKYAWALKAGKKHRQAVFEFESALASVPAAMPPARRVKMKKKEAWIYLGMAESWAALRERDRALKAVITALSRNSNLARAIKLRKKLDPSYRPDGE